jgi:hypothetical protein
MNEKELLKRIREIGFNYYGHNVLEVVIEK